VKQSLFIGVEVMAPSPACTKSSWEDAYFQCEFTHAAGAIRLTSHAGGFIGLWRSLIGRKKFPVQYLTDAGETLQEFVPPGS
jgi:hypothetical protein